MGFLRSTKGSIISDYFKLQEDIAGFSKGYMYDVALYDDHLEITSMQKRKLLLNYDQITDVFYGFETELVEKPKSVIGRAAVGGILFGGVGAIVGAASGTGTKTEKELLGVSLSVTPVQTVKISICSLKIQESTKEINYIKNKKILHM